MGTRYLVGFIFRETGVVYVHLPYLDISFKTFCESDVLNQTKVLQLLLSVDGSDENPQYHDLNKQAEYPMR